MFQADVFSYGIILCEIIARVEADPDILPRTEVSILLYCQTHSFHALVVAGVGL